MLKEIGLLSNILFLFFLYLFIWRISKTSFSYLLEKESSQAENVPDARLNEGLYLADGAGQTYKMAESPIIVGRSADCDIRLADDFVSQHHATLFSRGSKWLIKDENSTNGTFVNGKQIFDETPLKASDHVTFGRPTLRVEAGR